MLNQTNVRLGKVRSTIRELYEYAKRRKAEIGDENVYDFSLGNPSVPSPDAVRKELIYLVENVNPVNLHGYTSAQGDYSVRKAVSDYTNSRFCTSLTPDCIYMTCGAAASLTITFNALLNEGEEIITFVPFFPEYKVFCEKAGGKLVTLPSDNSLQPDFPALKAALNKNTKAVLINSPNNPSGAVYPKSTIEKLVAIISDYSKAHNQPIYLIADEPYRELVYDKETVVPYIMNYYTRSIVCYSYSKSLSLPGERIGYIAVNNEMEEWNDLYAAVCGAGRALGYVCAPNIMQQLVARCVDKVTDISVYKRNRDLLMEKLSDFGFEFIRPDGAFYLFIKSPSGSGAELSERAKKYEIMLVAGDDFGASGYVRLSYCVSPEMLERSLPAFEKLANSYFKGQKI